MKICHKWLFKKLPSFWMWCLWTIWQRGEGRCKEWNSCLCKFSDDIYTSVFKSCGKHFSSTPCSPVITSEMIRQRAKHSSYCSARLHFAISTLLEKKSNISGISVYEETTNEMLSSSFLCLLFLSNTSIVNQVFSIFF